ncbi:MAG: hypothetical protein AAGF95_25760 [Chloroflexota bacterium]
MSFHAELVTNNNNVLPLVLPDGATGGKALLAFLVPLELFCQGKAEAEVQHWFAALESKQTLCQITESFLHSWYDGNWQYQEDDYGRYLQEHVHDPMTEATFRETICTLNSRWSATQPLRASAEALLQRLTSEDRTATWWYHPQATPLELQALIDTIERAENSGATLVRICFM